MKKAIIILVVLCLLLTACAKNVERSGTTVEKKTVEKLSDKTVEQRQIQTTEPDLAGQPLAMGVTEDDLKMLESDIEGISTEDIGGLSN